MHLLVTPNLFPSLALQARKEPLRVLTESNADMYTRQHLFGLEPSAKMSSRSSEKVCINISSTLCSLVQVGCITSRRNENHKNRVIVPIQLGKDW